MTDEITQLEKQLLQGAVADLEAIHRGRPIPGVTGWYAIQNAKADAAESLVRLSTSRWVGRGNLSPAERMAVSRALGRLEKRGLAERACVHFAEERPNYLLVTDAGRKLVKELQTAEAATDG